MCCAWSTLNVSLKAHQRCTRKYTLTECASNVPIICTKDTLSGQWARSKTLNVHLKL